MYPRRPVRSQAKSRAAKSRCTLHCVYVSLIGEQEAVAVAVSRALRR